MHIGRMCSVIPSVFTLNLSTFKYVLLLLHHCKSKMTAWKKNSQPLDVDLKIYSHFFHKTMHKNLKMAANLTAASRKTKFWTLCNSTENLTMTSAQKLIKVFNHCDHIWKLFHPELMKLETQSKKFSVIATNIMLRLLVSLKLARENRHPPLHLYANAF